MARDEGPNKNGPDSGKPDRCGSPFFCSPPSFAHGRAAESHGRDLPGPQAAWIVPASWLASLLGHTRGARQCQSFMAALREERASRDVVCALLKSMALRDN